MVILLCRSSGVTHCNRVSELVACLHRCSY